MSEVRDLAHDQALYAFEGATNFPLHPDPVVRQAAADSFNRGFDAAWEAATEHALAIALNTIDVWTDGYQGEGSMRPLEDCVTEDVRSGVLEPSPYKH